MTLHPFLLSALKMLPLKAKMIHYTIKRTMNKQSPNQNGVPKEHILAGRGAIFLCAVLWSTSGLFIKLVDWHPVIIAGARSFLAIIVLLVFRFISMRRAGKFRAKNNPVLVMAGGVSYALTMISFVVANKLTASANVILLQYTAPIWACLLGWILIKEKPRKEIWVSLVMVMAGLFIFFREGLSGGALLGDSIALLSGLLFGAQSVFMRMQKDGNPADSMIAAHSITVAVCIPFLFLYPPALNPGTIGAILFMGIFQIGLASQLFSFGIKRTPALEAMLTSMIEPVLNPLWVLLVTGEKPSSSALIGGTVIITAVVFSAVAGNRRQTG
jgi:drug/metabolite transporter (DMT)-like permease